MSRKQPKRRAGNMVFGTMAGIFIFAIVCGVGFGVASADSADDYARAGAFGFDSSTNAATASASPRTTVNSDAQLQAAYYEQSVLTSTSKRTIDSGLQMIDRREAAERARIEADNAAVFDRVEAAKEKQGAVQAVQEKVARQAEEAIYEYDLPAVDWSVGYDAFLEEWSARIDTFLDGSPLAGYGRVFAEAAWENGVDPRWSPAISCTESGKGSVCFMPYNAWGWGENGWSDWETAIRAHVAGLADGYGYCITPEAAAKYCPPNSAFWYANTISQMASI